MPNHHPLYQKRLPTFLSILLIIPLGFYTKLYKETGETWINNHLGGTFYVIFWCLIVFLIIPNVKPGIIAIWVLAITILLEFLQLWHPKFPEIIQESYIGKAILGSSFNWRDIIFYFIGFVLATMWLKRLSNIKFVKKF